MGCSGRVFMVLPGRFPDKNSTNMFRFLIPENRFQREFDDITSSAASLAEAIRADVAPFPLGTEPSHRCAAILAAKTPEEIIAAIRAAINALVERLWAGERPRWVKIVLAVPEIAAFLWSVFRALTAKPA